MTNDRSPDTSADTVAQSGAASEQDRVALGLSDPAARVRPPGIEGRAAWH